MGKKEKINISNKSDEIMNKMLDNLVSLDKTMNKMLNKLNKLDKLNELNSRFNEMNNTMNNKFNKMLDKLDEMNKKLNKLDEMSKTMDEMSLSLILFGMDRSRENGFTDFARQGGVGPEIEESFSMENSMDSSDLDELPDEVYKYEDY